MVMKSKELLELVAMLLIEKKSYDFESFTEYILERVDKETFNNRYKILLDKFLTMYAVTNTEKSD